MASKTIHPVSHVQGKIEVLGDKSISHRAVILGALSVTPTHVQNFLVGEDCLATVKAFQQMGVPIERHQSELNIQGKGLKGLRAPISAIDCGNSGTTARLIMGVLTGQNFEVELKGDISLSQRPMGRVMEPLSRMGAVFIQKNPNKGRLPLKIHGTDSVKPFQGQTGLASAQVKSAILLAGLYANGKTTVTEIARSRDHTERMLRACGVNVVQKESQVSLTGPATLRAKDFQVPGDLSSAAFFLAAGILLSPEGIIVRDVGVNKTRTGFIDILKTMDANIQVTEKGEIGGESIADIKIKESKLKAAAFGGELVLRSIDEIPILTVLATQAKGITKISDAGELRVKESDRLLMMRKELSKMGARLFDELDGLVIEGPTSLKGAVVNSHGDHRLAMSLAIAGLIAEGPTTIEDVACVDTSFPNFWELLDAIRAS